MGNTTDSPPPAASLSARLRRSLPLIVAGLAFAVVAGVTGRVSYLHIEALSLTLGQPPDIARIMPFGIDGLIVVGSVALLQAGQGQEWLGWTCIGPGTAASLFANVESGLSHGPLAAGWAGMASVGFFVATFAFERWLKSQAGRGTSPRPATAPNPQTDDAPATPGGIIPDVPGQPSPGLALQAFLASAPDPELALICGVSRNKVRSWRDRSDTAGGAPDEPGAPPFSDVPRLPTLAELGAELAVNGSAP